MRTLSIYIELNGAQRYVGSIHGETYLDALFSYEKTDNTDL